MKNHTEKQNKYWYKFSMHMCHMCGCEHHDEKERMFTPKPKNCGERHTVTERYDYCNN